MMKKRIVLPFVLGIVLAAGVYFLAPAGKRTHPDDAPAKGPAEKADVVLFTSALDGYDGLAEAAERGATIAADKINAAGGVLGKSLRLRRETISGTAPAAAPGLFALFAGTEAEKQLAIAWAEAKKTPLFLLTDGPCRTLTHSTDTASPYIWSLGLTWQTSIEPLFVYLNDTYSRPDKPFTLIYLGGETAESHRMIDEAKDEAESLGFKTIDSQFYDVRMADYFPMIRSILSRAPHVLVVSNPGLAGRIFMQQAAKLGIGKEMALASVDTFAPEFFEANDPSLEGTYSVGKYNREAPGEINARFIDELKKQGAPEYVLSGSVAAMGYTAVELAAHAFKKAPKPGVEAFATALAGMEMNSPGGRVRMNALNHILEQPLFVMQREKGSWKVKQDLGTAVHPRLEECGSEPPRE